MRRGLRRYVEDLLHQRRPRRFRADGEDEAVLRAAITLRAARPGSGVPRDAFVTALRERLGNELAPPATTPRGATRRRFVQAASLAATAAALGAGVDHLVDDGGSSRGSDQTLTPAAGRWRTVAAGADLPEGAVQSFDFGAVSGFVTRAGGEVRAVSGICTHQSCRLALDVASRQLNCPCHNAAFALTGEVLRHELKAPLRPLPHLLAREVDGDVQVYAP